MYKLFKVPGRSAVDAISSWLGDGTLGIMITNTQYKQGFYTAKEAAIISVCFSLVSLPFSTIIADQLGLMNLFVPLIDKFVINRPFGYKKVKGDNK